MTHHDWYLALLVIACAMFTWAAVARKQPASVSLVPAGLAVWVLAAFLLAAGFL